MRTSPDNGIASDNPEETNQSNSPILFQLPVDCRTDEGGTPDCLIQNYKDHDTTRTSFKDFSCGPRGYDGHTGTDFRVLDDKRYRDGIAVFAAADGRVSRIEGREPDGLYLENQPAAERRNPAGNVVLLQHDFGYRTLYAHLKKGSVTVEPGDYVKAGDVIGFVGLSGFTEFPHLHFEIRRKTARTEFVDPFSFQGNETCVEERSKKQRLWSDDNNPSLQYQDTRTKSGWLGEKPKSRELNNPDKPKVLLGQSDIAIYWVQSFHQTTEQELLLKIKDSSGNLLSKHQCAFESFKAQTLCFVGVRLSSLGLTGRNQDEILQKIYGEHELRSK
ncbi:M23 family metallopeptidase [Kiloniella sp. b19]|uniref:M23 family metallopeptidase n=1 Tax=Kiloniella sp. GXU_MW_B19 TaxID=3141326 RepID=UPI0031D3E0AA